MIKTVSSLSSFNTQPPEGGCVVTGRTKNKRGSFNTQPPEGGWLEIQTSPNQTLVSTHSRPKAAG